MKFHPTLPTSKAFLNQPVIVVGAIVAGLTGACAPVAPPSQVAVPSKHGGVTSPEFIADPHEPLNRGVWAVNEAILAGFMKPTAQVYRAIVPGRARESVRDFTRNVTYPGRVVNNMLQGRWTGAGDESLRFITNTTVGIGGLFDVASHWNIPKSDADFGQTFMRWGWKPEPFLMLPVYGPSDGPHAAGFVADEAAEPWNWARPYVYASYGSDYNGFSDHTEEAAQLISTEADPYAGVKEMWSYASKDGPPDWQTSGPKDAPTLQTLGVALIRPQDPKFLENSRVMSVRMPSTGRKMKFNYWLQKSSAPLVYVAPGLGQHRESNVTLALAEMIYQNGFSVVTTTGVFHPDFMENASTAELPAYPPVDSHDMLVELTAFDRTLEGKFPGRFGKRALVGFSMGGYQSLYLAAREEQADTGLLRFDRYVAINTPVDFLIGNKAVDAYYKAPDAWPSDVRQAKVNNTVHKVAALASLPPASLANPPFDGIESKFLVGLSFRLTLRDTIFSSQIRHNRGVLQTPLSKWRRDPCYAEISQYSFKDYFDLFAVPCYQEQGISRGDITREINLRTYQKYLRSNPKVRVMVNQDDFILNAGDVSWLRSTISPSRLTVFPNGGHLGNLTSAPVRKAVAGSLEGLN